MTLQYSRTEKIRRPTSYQPTGTKIVRKVPLLLRKQWQMKINVHFLIVCYFCSWSSRSLVHIRFISSPRILYHNHHNTVKPSWVRWNCYVALTRLFFSQTVGIWLHIYSCQCWKKVQRMAAIRSFNRFLVVFVMLSKDIGFFSINQSF